MLFSGKQVMAPEHFLKTNLSIMIGILSRSKLEWWLLLVRAKGQTNIIAKVGSKDFIKNMHDQMITASVSYDVCQLFGLRGNYTYPCPLPPPDPSIELFDNS